MTRAELTEKIVGIKRDKDWSWKHICDEIGGMSPLLITGAVLGQMKLTKPQAAKAAELFGLSKGEQALLNEVPYRGAPMPPARLTTTRHRRSAGPGRAPHPAARARGSGPAARQCTSARAGGV